MTAGSTYTPIATTTLASAVSSYTFSSISGSYTDLILVTNVQGQTAGCNMQIWFNGDGSSTNYSSSTLYQISSTTIGSTRNSNAAKLNFGTNGGMPFANASQFGMTVYNIQNYSNTTTYKTTIATTTSPDGGYTGAMELDLSTGLWRSTAAITSIDVGVDNGKTMQIGTSLTLYGILAA